MFVFKNAFFSSLVEEVGLQKLPCIDKTESSITQLLEMNDTV